MILNSISEHMESTAEKGFEGEKCRIDYIISILNF